MLRVCILSVLSVCCVCMNVTHTFVAAPTEVTEQRGATMIFTSLDLDFWVENGVRSQVGSARPDSLRTEAHMSVSARHDISSGP